MTERQERLKEELHAYKSLVDVLRRTDWTASVQALSRMRLGDYDSWLQHTDSALEPTTSTARVYPWNEPFAEGGLQQRLGARQLMPAESVPVEENVVLKPVSYRVSGSPMLLHNIMHDPDHK